MSAATLRELEATIQGTQGARRQRALSTLKSRATRARQRGVPEGENTAVRSVRAVGVPARQKGLVTLERLGLLEVLAARIHRRPLYTLDLLLEATGKPLDQITAADVALFVSGRPSQTAAVLRSQVRCVFEQLIALGLAQHNPAPRHRRPRTALPAPFAAELATLERFQDEQRSARSTRSGTEEALRRATKWAVTRGQTSGLDKLLWQDDAALLDFATWWAGPRENGTLRSVACMPALFTFLLRLWRAHGRSVVEGRDHIRRLKRSLRTSGDDMGPFTRLDLLSEDPAPAPAPVRCEKLERWYAEEVVRLRSLGERARPSLVAVQRERQAFFILWKVGIRRSSLASLRYDMLKLDDDGQWYFDACVTKRTREPKRQVVQTWRIGNTTFSRWYIPPVFREMLAEALRDEGYDLEQYLATREERFVPWETARSGTFGPHLDGQRISPVWRGKRGHLTGGAVAGIARCIVRGRMGMSRGGTHAIRRRSIMDNNALARQFPQAAQALQHLTPETRATYEWGEERSVRHMFEPSASNPSDESGELELAQPSTARANEKPANTERAAHRTRLRVPRMRALTLDDLR